MCRFANFQIESLEDMRRFVTEHTDFTALQSNVSKHVNLMTELSETINRRNLMEISMVGRGTCRHSSNS